MSIIRHFLKSVSPASNQGPATNLLDEAILDGMERDSRERATASHQRVIEAANRVSKLNGKANGHSGEDH